MDVQAQDGTIHSFPDGTKQDVIDKVLVNYNKNTKVPPNQMGVTDRLLTGMSDPIVGGSQLAAHLTKSPEEAAKVDLAIKKREQDIQGAGGGGLVRGVGQAITGAPLIAAGALGPAGAIAGGALQGAAQPTVVGSGTDYWAQKEKDALFGAAFGYGLGGGLGKTVGMAVGPDARTMIGSGVNLTPGQMIGGPVRRLEEAAKSLPIMGSFIRGAEGRGIEGFNRAVLNQALEPIGGKLSRGAAGREAIAETQKQLGDAYDKLLPNMQLTLDQQLANDIANVKYHGQELPEPMQKQLEGILNNRLAPFFQRSPMPGRQGPTLKETESALRSIADNYRGSADPAQRNLARLIDDARGSLRDALIRQNPNSADLLKKIDMGYALFARAQGAAARRASSQGLFTANDLLATIKSQDKTIRKSAFARGDALLQDYAEVAQRVLPGKMPDSGTPERLLWDAALLGGAGGGAHVAGATPEQLITAGTALAGASVPYTRPGIAALNAPLRATLPSKVAPYAAIAAEPAAKQEYGGPLQ